MLGGVADGRSILIVVKFYTLELSVKRLRRFDLPSADLDHAMIMGVVIWLR